jgi:hypothetical protein
MAAAVDTELSTSQYSGNIKLMTQYGAEVLALQYFPIGISQAVPSQPS